MGMTKLAWQGGGGERRWRGALEPRPALGRKALQLSPSHSLSLCPGWFAGHIPVSPFFCFCPHSLSYSRCLSSIPPFPHPQQIETGSVTCPCQRLSSFPQLRTETSTGAICSREAGLSSGPEGLGAEGPRIASSVCLSWGWRHSSPKESPGR